MKVFGIGIDMVDLNRVKIIYSRYGDKFAKKILNHEEFGGYTNAKNKPSFLAKRFAAKEAFAKTIGTGFRYNLSFKDIAIVNDKLGKPSFLITEKIKKIVKKQFKTSSFDFFLSISDEKKYSIAYVVLQKK